MSPKNTENGWSRRRFLGTLGAGAGLVAGGGYLLKRGLWQAHFGKAGSGLALTEAQFPLTRITDTAQTAFSGDHFMRPHSWLWQKEQKLREKGGIPAPSETVSVVIVGGGISGLASAWHLREFKPLILEQDPQFGGNSKGEQWNDLKYSIGAAYVCPPDKGSKVEKFFQEIGIDKDWRHAGTDLVSDYIYEGKVSKGFWSGSSDPAQSGEFARVGKIMKEIYDKKLPDFPPEKDAALSLDELKALDAISFRDWYLQNLGPKTHKHIEEFFEEYCWSSSGGTMAELSAAQVLAFLGSDLQGIAVFPGGNAAISHAVLGKLVSALPPSHLRGGALVIDVTNRPDGVAVCYEMPDGTLKTVLAKTCIMTCAKFIAKKLISKIPPDQFEAMSRLRYRSYLVANVLIKTKLESPTYDCFRLTGQVPGAPDEEFSKIPYTDFVFGGWAAHDQPGQSVITLYKGLAFDTGRNAIYLPDAFANAQKSFAASIPDLVKVVGVHPDQISGVRVARWGHPLPLGEKGLVANGIVQKAHQPIERIFFAQQDNWASPAFECAFGTSLEAAESARKFL